MLKRKQELENVDEPPFKKPKLGESKGGSHQKNAQRYFQLCKDLDAIKNTYKREVPKNQSQNKYPKSVQGESYLVTHLKYWIQTYVDTSKEYKTRTNVPHQVMSNTQDGRRPLPSTIVKACHEALPNSVEWKPTSGNKLERKVTVTWIVCYLNNIHPDTTKQNWEAFDCSHCCICWGLKEFNLVCIDFKCLCWESKAINQERGNSYCCKKCQHTGCTDQNGTICKCNSLHDPPCK